MASSPTHGPISNSRHHEIFPTFSASLIGLLLITCTHAAGSEKKIDTVPGAPVKETRSGSWAPSLTDNDKKTLFLIARDTLTWCAKDKKKTFSFANYQLTATLLNKTPVYLSIKIDDKRTLRSGELSFKQPLCQAVHDHVKSVVLDKNKSSRISPAEAAKAQIHITLVSKLKGVRSLAGFKLGEHGLYLQKKPHRSVLLPDELAKRGQDIQTILANLIVDKKKPRRKNFWNRGARYYTFTTITLSQ